MAELKKFVECTPEQYITLLKEGQIEINGEIKTKEENTYYMPGELTLLEWYNKIMEAQYRKYKVNHSPMNMKSLEQEYNELVENDEIIKYVSAVGYTAILKNGNTIKVTTPNTGIFFVNGEKTTKDYTYTGDGYEVVNVWCFEGKEGQLIHPLSLNDEPTFFVSEINIKNIGQTPIVNSGYYLYANTIKTYNFTLSSTPLAAEKIEYNGVNTITGGSFCSINIKYFESDCSEFNHIGNGIGSPLGNKTQLRKAIFPKLTSIGAGADNTHLFVASCTNKELEIYFPNLKTIANNASTSRCPFKNVYKVELPESVTYIGNYAFSGNSIIILNCNKATTINSNWCSSTPTVNFSMCTDWQASINIAVASKKHTKDWFIDLFQHKLHDFSGESVTREITIPLAIFNELTAEERAITENKNWVLGGA